MTRLSLVSASVLLAVLAGCATEHPVAPAPAPVVVQPQPASTAGAAVVVPQANAPAVVVPPASAPAVVVAASPGPLRAGHGRVEGIVPVPPAAAAGSSLPRADKRLSIRMDDATMQYLDTSAPNIAVGDRVQITADGRMIHPAP